MPDETCKEPLLADRAATQGLAVIVREVFDADLLKSLDFGRISGLKVKLRLTRVSMFFTFSFFLLRKSRFLSQKLFAYFSLMRLGVTDCLLTYGLKVSSEASAMSF